MTEPKPWHDPEVRKRIVDMIGGGAPRSANDPGWLPDRFRFERPLGRGGMGVVVAAHDLELDRPVAIKTRLWPTSELDEHAKRFRREGETLAAMRHPGVVQVHELIPQEGADCLVMELVEGESLGARIAREGPLPAAEVLDLGIRLAAALEHVHAHGVLHRDLKPTNIMLDASGAPKLVDFGLVHRGDQSRLTETGAVLGTPGFMAPEQVRGHQADRRTDVYGLGATLYAALTGEPPCVRVEGGPHQALYATLKTTPTPARKLNPQVPIGLSQACDRCLQKQAGERFDTAAELGAELERLRAGGAAKRVPNVWGLLAVVALLVVGLLVVALGGSADAPAAVRSSVATPLSPSPAPTSAPTAPATTALPRAGLLLASPGSPRRVAFVGRSPVAWSTTWVRAWTPDGEPRALTIDRRPESVATRPGTSEGEGAVVAVGFSDSTGLFGLDSRQPRRILSLPCAALAWSSRGLVAVGGASRLTLVAEASGATVAQWAIDRFVHRLVFSADGRHLVGLFGSGRSSEPRTIQVWSIEQRRRIARWSLQAIPTCAVFTRAGRIAVGDDAGMVRLYDPKDVARGFTHLQRPFEPARTHRAQFDDVSAVLSLPNGDLLTTGCDVTRDQVVNAGNDFARWNPTTGKLLGTYGWSKTRRYFDAALSPDGSTLLIAYGDPPAVRLHALEDVVRDR